MKECGACGAQIDQEARFCPHCGEAQGGTRPDRMIGRLLDGRYRITSRIGRGGMATVYLARHEGLARDVAVKLLHPHVSRNERAVTRFAHEARTTSRIAHDNVVGVFDFAFDRECASYLLVMEHVPGATLAGAIEQNGPFPAGRAVHVLAQIAAALRCCHAAGVVHRDLKTENILLTRRGSDADFVKILDFGLTRELDADPELARLSHPGELMGTPATMAPEQWNGRAADERTDVYAFGIVAYELLTSTEPFQGTTLIEYFLEHMRGAAVPPTERAPQGHVPSALDELVMRAIAKEPSDRFQSMDEVLAALGQVWRTAELRPRGGASTYAGTMASPPRPRPDSMPDPTVYQSDRLDVVWDAPSLVEEIGRLHRIRGRRLAELVEAAWPTGPPPTVAETLPRIAHLEEELAHTCQASAELRLRIEADEQLDRETEAMLRAKIVEASLKIGNLWSDPTEIEVVLPEAREDGDETTYRQRAERRLFSFMRKRQHARSAMEQALENHLAAMRDTLGRLDALYSTIHAELSALARHSPPLRKHLLEFAKVDGAIESYRALLLAMESVAEDGSS